MNTKKRKFYIKKICLISLGLLLLGYVCFQFNLGGLQDIYYDSKYFRPYAHLKQEPEAGNIIQLKDGKILLLGYEHSELFDPMAKKSVLIDGLSSIKAVVDPEGVNLLSLKNGDVLITSGAYIEGGTVDCRYQDHKFCYPDGQQRIPLYDSSLNKFRWIPFPLRYLEGHTASLLSDGNVLFVGGVDNYSQREHSKYLDNEPIRFDLKNNIILYNPINYQARVLGRLQIARYNHTTILSNEHEALVFGGYRNSGKDGKFGEHGKIKEVELINFKTGQSKIVAKLQNGAYLNKIFKVGPSDFLVAQNSPWEGVVVSELLDLNHPEETSIIKWPLGTLGKPMATGTCEALPNNKIICVGSGNVQEIDPSAKEGHPFDTLARTQPLTNIKVIYNQKAGLLVFAAARYRNVYFSTPETLVQQFNYQRFLKDFGQQEKK